MSFHVGQIVTLNQSTQFQIRPMTTIGYGRQIVWPDGHISAIDDELVEGNKLKEGMFRITGFGPYGRALLGGHRFVELDLLQAA